MLKDKLGHVYHELKHHAPFTMLGAVLGVVFMLAFRNISTEGSGVLFGIFHPAHVILSAMVTAALFRMHRRDAGFVKVLLIGYIGSIGIATLSDCVIPYAGERMLHLHIPAHFEVYHAAHGDHDGHLGDGHKESETVGHTTDERGHGEPERAIVDNHDGCSCTEPSGPSHGDGSPALHLGFIEHWYLVNPAALLGILIGYYWPRTEMPHALHILVSTWASSAHMMMNSGGQLDIAQAIGLVAVLFLAVLLPCCLSDIVFPSLFISGDMKTCSHRDHSHNHQESDQGDD